MEAEVRKPGRFEDDALLDLKMQEGVQSQRIQVVSRSWKKQEKRFSSRASRRNTAWRIHFHLLLFFLSTLRGMRYLTSPTRDLTHTPPPVEARILNHQTTREVPIFIF